MSKKVGSQFSDYLKGPTELINPCEKGKGNFEEPEGVFNPVRWYHWQQQPLAGSQRPRSLSKLQEVLLCFLFCAATLERLFLLLLFSRCLCLLAVNICFFPSINHYSLGTTAHVKWNVIYFFFLYVIYIRIRNQKKFKPFKLVNLLFTQMFFLCYGWLLIVSLQQPHISLLTASFSFLEVKCMSNPVVVCATQAEPTEYPVPLATTTGWTLGMRPNPSHSECNSWCYHGILGKRFPFIHKNK